MKVTSLDRFLTGVALVLFLACAAPAQTSPAGHWEGTLKADNRDITLGLDIARNAKSEWIASMSVPAENATGLVVQDVAVNGNSVKFTAVEIMMSKVDLTPGPDGRMTGTISNRGMAQPIEFKRTGEANVQLTPASPAVSRELEGDWEGSAQTPGGAFRILFHFRNQPDGTVAATVDTPDSGAFGLPLNDVKQSGQKVELGLKIAHATFQGTLNSATGQLEGQFKHEETGFPLTLRKK